MKLRRLFSGAVAGAVLLAMSACGSGGSGGSGGSDGAEGVAANLSTDNFASEVAAATSQEKSAHIEAEMSFQGETMTMAGDMATAAEIADLAAQITLDVPGEGAFEMRIVDSGLYLKGGGLTSDPAKPWTKIDLSDPSNPLGAFYEQLVATANPAQAVKMFEAVTALEKVGGEDVDGVEATHYEVTVDLKKALKLSGLSDGMGAAYDAAVAEKPDELTYDVWLETDTALMVRMSMAMQGMDMDLHFSDWGKAVSVKAPPADRVTEFSF